MKKFFLIKGAIMKALAGCFVMLIFFTVAKAADNTSRIPQAVLFISDTCVCCHNLEHEQFSQKFKEKYKGTLTLKIYEIHSEEGSRLAQKLPITGTPNLFVGKTRVGQSCHTEEMLNAVDKELARRKKLEAEAAQRARAQVAETNGLKGIAPQKDLIFMQKYIERTQNTNEQTLASMAPLFNNWVVWQATALISQNEKKLKMLAAQSPSFPAFKQQADKLEIAQQQQLEQLIQASRQPAQP